LSRVDAPFLLSKLIEFAAETLCAHSQSRFIRKNLYGRIPWFTFFARSERTQETRDFSIVNGRLAKLQQDRIDHYTIVKQYRRKDGTLIWGHGSLARSSSGSGAEMFIGMLVDITESIRAQEQLRVTQSELARVTRLTAAGQIAAAVAHEINQPLAVIALGCDTGLRWLAKTPPDLEEVRATLKRMAGASHRASEVIDGIRAMFKNDNREKTLLDINQVIRDVLALLRSELQIHQILVQTELSPDVPSVLADRVLMQQVIANLVMNAAEAMNSVNARARTLRLKSVIREPDGVLITVEDSGPGIDPEIMDHIFHPFFTTKSHGTGIGLSICRSIVEAYDGRLSARSGADQGSVFEIVLPIADSVGKDRETA
jgi:PAS domain S-box-containing protein